MPNDKEDVTFKLSYGLALTLYTLLRKECRRLEREIDKRPENFVLKGRDVTMYKLLNYAAILDSFPKGGFDECE